MIWQEHAYLMVDLELVEAAEGCSMVRAEPYKQASNPVDRQAGAARVRGKNMTPVGTLPWCVRREGGVYRMWYGAPARQSQMFGFAYAESDDGVHFKPKRISTANGNQVIVTDRDDVRACRIMHDPVDSEFPYKCVVLKPATDADFNPGVRAKYPLSHNAAKQHQFMRWFVWGLARSRDGFDWQLPTHDALMIDESIEEPTPHRGLDGGMFIGSQMVSRTSDIAYRKVKGWVTYDNEAAAKIPGFTFALPDHMTMTYARWLGKTQFENIPWVQSHVNLVCARKGPTMLALHGFLYGNHVIERYAQVASTGLAVSSTGYDFRMVWPFHEYIRRGDMGAWDCQFVRQQAMCETDTQTLMYYHGGDHGNTNAGAGRRGLGVAMIDRDRFGYFVLHVNNDHTPRPLKGIVTLKPMTLPQRPKMLMNVSHVSRAQTVRMELRDVKTGRILPGFSMKRCRAITRDGLQRRVQWPGADVARLAGRTVQPVIELASRACACADVDSPRVYALYTQ